MRRSREDAAETRRAIVEAASRMFRERGIGAVSVADIMGSLGLTVGGFYRHFESKDALAAEAIQAASTQTTQRIEGAELRALLDGYLSMPHRAARAEGCPIAALCGEMAHEPGPAREAFRDALGRLIEAVRDTLEREGHSFDREEVLHTVSAMVGALVLSRATPDDKLGAELLEATRRRLKRDHRG
jgi:TetR/AcrR family transcriptional repressor of nem operon